MGPDMVVVYREGRICYVRNSAWEKWWRSKYAEYGFGWGGVGIGVKH